MKRGSLAYMLLFVLLLSLVSSPAIQAEPATVGAPPDAVVSRPPSARTPDQPLEWVIETVDDAFSVGTDTSIAVDAAGNPHIAYYDELNGDLKYAYKPDNTWHVYLVDPGGLDNDDVGRYVRLALDQYDRPHVSYWNATRQDLMYVFKTAEGWQWAQRFETSDRDGFYTDIALTDGGRPRISYYNESVGCPCYVLQWDDGTWGRACWCLPGSPTGGTHTSIAVQRTGWPAPSLPIMAWYEWNAASVWYGYEDGYGFWPPTICFVNTEYDRDVGTYNSMDMDANGNPAFSYYDALNGCLRFASTTPGDRCNYNNEWVDCSGSTGWYSSLVMDLGVTPMISYHDIDSGDLKFATKTGDGWQVELIDYLNNVGAGSSLAVDVVTGLPHIAYYDATLHVLKYAHKATVVDRTFLPLVIR